MNVPIRMKLHFQYLLHKLFYLKKRCEYAFSMSNKSWNICTCEKKLFEIDLSTFSIYLF